MAHENKGDQPQLATFFSHLPLSSKFHNTHALMWFAESSVPKKGDHP